MVTRKAILLKYTEKDLEDFRSNFDFGLVKSFLCSATGGGFEENEIIELRTNEIENEEELFTIIDNVDYSFIYFSGQSLFFDRKVHFPLKNKLMSAFDLHRENKWQWLFFDTSRTGLECITSPEFSFERAAIQFSKKNEESHKQWLDDIHSLPNSTYINYYTAQLEKHAFSNEHGGYGTQLFFTTLSEVLQNKPEIHLKELVSIIGDKKDVLQKGMLFSSYEDDIIFRKWFSEVLIFKIGNVFSCIV